MDKNILTELIEQNLSTHSIAKTLNLSQTNIRYWLKKYDLKTQSLKKDKLCLYCNTILKNNFSIYCNESCHKQDQYTKYIEDWKNGSKLGYVGKTKKLASTIRKYMLLKTNNSCESCGWNKLHPKDNKPLVEIDHIDGDAENCVETNLRVLCPNCHSMTDTFRARNKKSKRIRS